MILLGRNIKVKELENRGIKNRLLQAFFGAVGCVGIEPDDLLNHVDIITAINYYGIAELLQTIGDERLKLHLECL